jgi:hypothetical protein
VAIVVLGAVGTRWHLSVGVAVGPTRGAPRVEAGPTPATWSCPVLPVTSHWLTAKQLKSTKREKKIP